MKHFTNQIDFDKNMETFKNILDLKGFVLESDHAYAYSMRHSNAFEDVKDWLINHGYDGHLNSLGAYDKVAVYGLYDSDRITYEEMYKQLLKEAERQNSMI